MSELRKLDRQGERLLAKSGLALYQALLKKRGPRGPDFEAELRWLAKKAGLPYETARRALARLRDAGLVETVRVHCEIESRSWEKRRLTVNRYHVLGQLKNRRGAVTFEVPTSFVCWAKTQTPQGRPRKNFASNSEKKFARAKTKVNDRPPKMQTGIRVSNADKPKDAEGLNRKDARTPIYKERSFYRVPPVGGEPSKKDSERPKSSPPFFQIPPNLEPEKPGGLVRLGGRHPLRVQARRKPSEVRREPTSTPPPAKFGESFADVIALLSGPRPRRKRNSAPLRLPMLDPVPRELNNMHESLTSDMTDSQLVLRVVRAYNRAHLEVFGEMGHAYARSLNSVLRSKFYPQLLAAAKALLEKGHRPQSWACWRMKYYADNSKKCPPVHVIFGAKIIRSKSGWFRKDYDADAGWKSAPTQENREQFYRRREAVRRHNGQQSLVGFPWWYAEMRKDERSRGVECPLSLYPRVRKGSSPCVV